MKELHYHKYLMVLFAMNCLVFFGYHMSEIDEGFISNIYIASSKQRNIVKEILQKEEIPYSVQERSILEKLVEAEAGGEGIKGKILVCNVVLNRVESEEFPNDITSVIYEERNGRYQFSPISNGVVERVVVSEETKQAVELALYGEDYAQGALYFVARSHANQENLRWFDQMLTPLFRHGGHEFFR